MGKVDNMRMGRDADGNEIMEIGPRAKSNEEQPQVGPFYIYPQVGNMPGSQQGTQQGGQSTTPSGRPGTTYGGQQGQTRPIAPPPSGQKRTGY
jgi:hypothetical protein